MMLRETDDYVELEYDRHGLIGSLTNDFEMESMKWG
jgi:hypothetical protein